MLLCDFEPSWQISFPPLSHEVTKISQSWVIEFSSLAKVYFI